MTRNLLAALAFALTVSPAIAADTNTLTKIKNPATIIADRTYYDRPEGIIVFTGNVYVDDPDYQMHADKAYVFMSTTNDLKRLVATGNVALTNDTKRAYGSKVTYRRDSGLVVLYAPTNGLPCEVREELPDGPRTVRGKKIRFWINREQVEVLEADITAPNEGISL